MKIFFDGGCRPNPGRMEVAVVARGKLYHRPDVGCGTSSEAEWRALLYALEVAQSLGEGEIVALGDSATVVGQAKGTLKCRDAYLAQCLAEFRSLEAHFATVRVRHVRRTQNLAGIALARLEQRYIRSPA